MSKIWIRRVWTNNLDFVIKDKILSWLMRIRNFIFNIWNIFNITNRLIWINIFTFICGFGIRNRNIRIRRLQLEILRIRRGWRWVKPVFVKARSWFGFGVWIYAIWISQSTSAAFTCGVTQFKFTASELEFEWPAEFK